MSANEPVSELVELAKRQQHGESARRDQASFHAFEARLAKRHSIWYRARSVVMLGTGALVLALFWFAPWFVGAPEAARAPLAESPLRYVLLASGPARFDHMTRPLDSGPADGDSTSQLRFSDGTSVALGVDSEAHVESTTPRGAHVVLSRGSVTAAVVPHRGGDWWFEAGPYRVHVTGTSFLLQWSPERQLFTLTMHTGSVDVSGPLTGHGVSLQAGQRLVGALREERLVVEPVVSEPSSAAHAEADSSHEQGQNKTRRKGSSSERGFAQLVAQGQFAEVVGSARRAGIEPMLGHASASDLSALADAARYEGDDVLARRTLLSLRARFAKTNSGRSAAYFLARISRGDAAISWYNTYLKEQADGPFAAPALGGLMALHAERGATALAKRAAQGYLRRDPNGPYAATARKIAGDAAD